ncbi:hypothetical protein B9Z55_027042 [Caenorhabditis nigoni]|uniref:F-box domain-containing protein n=2 Tax=Caenorhabditis nigoni TaxID=1611254 RepID=A0A2G5SJ06_9PELO|nr:hypothetical protein B9Z55_027042 [Caenorhabditis nigoni]
MEMSSDLIKENHRLLKTCILYKVLQKEPIFDSYRNLCDTVGQDAMEYRDFEFWYYRFYHGNRDFDYDRSVDPEAKTLVDMPVVLMNKIAKNLDPVERIRLRTMNHAIKAVADSFPPVFEKIKITVSDSDLSWSLNDKMFICTKKCTGCSFWRPNSSEIEKYEECYMKKGLEYLAPVLKMPNIQVNHLSFTFFEGTPDRDDLLPAQFNAKSVHIYSKHSNEAVHFLSAMNPGYLESISLEVMFLEEVENYGIIFGTDQFKQAKSIEIKEIWRTFNVADLSSFSHLKTFKCQLMSDDILENLPRIRDMISIFKEFESCELEFFLYGNFPIAVFAQALGAEIPIGPLAEGERLTITHHYQIPDSNKCLEFKLKQEERNCRMGIRKIR